MSEILRKEIKAGKNWLVLEGETYRIEDKEGNTIFSFTVRELEWLNYEPFFVVLERDGKYKIFNEDGKEIAQANSEKELKKVEEEVKQKLSGKRKLKL
jgi:hypothetical protein